MTTDAERPPCFGTDDCSTAMLAHCRWASECGSDFPWIGARIYHLRTTIEAGDGTGHDLAELTVLREALTKLDSRPQSGAPVDQQHDIFSRLMRIEVDLVHQGVPSARAVELILEAAVRLAATAMAAGRLEVMVNDTLKRLQASPLPQTTRQPPPENGRPSWCRGVIDGDQLP